MYIHNDKIYGIVKDLAQIILPALATLYFSLSQIWGFPYGEEVVGTITAIDTFLGALLKISTNNYNSRLTDGKEDENES